MAKEKFTIVKEEKNQLKVGWLIALKVGLKDIWLLLQYADEEFFL